MLKRSILAVILISASTSAFASRHPKTAPEIDPILAIAGITLVTGTLAVVRSRRSR